MESKGSLSFFLWNECVSLEEKKKRENGWIVPCIYTSVEIFSYVHCTERVFSTCIRSHVSTPAVSVDTCIYIMYTVRMERLYEVHPVLIRANGCVNR